MISQRGSLIVINDTAPKKLSNVGAQAIHFFLIAVQSQGEELAVFNPEILVETLLQLCRLYFQLGCKRLILPYLTGQPGTAYLRIVGVALNLTGGPRSTGEGTIMEKDRIPRVLPTLIIQAQSSFALIFDVSVAVPISVMINPLKCRTGIRLKGTDKIGVAAPALVFVQ